MVRALEQSMISNRDSPSGVMGTGLHRNTNELPHVDMDSRVGVRSTVSTGIMAKDAMLGKIQRHCRGRRILLGEGAKVTHTALDAGYSIPALSSQPSESRLGQPRQPTSRFPKMGDEALKPIWPIVCMSIRPIHGMT